MGGGSFFELGDEIDKERWSVLLFYPKVPNLQVSAGRIGPHSDSIEVLGTGSPGILEP